MNAVSEPEIETRLSHDSITSSPGIMMGKPVIAGTRITVELILRKLAARESIEQILDSHPRLSRESIYAALRFASESLGHEIVHPLNGSIK